jgi:multidrug efflux pump subunit AcrB
MSIAAYAIRKKTITLVFVFLIAVLGADAYNKLGRLEDPAFTIKTAVIVTPYPGASAREVEEEVTERMESAAQQLPQVKRVRSVSQAGRSTVFVDIKDRYTAQNLPQVWDELRRKVSDAQRYLPPGAQPSLVNDDYGDVYGVFFAITGDGFSSAELLVFAKKVRKELLLVKDVAKVSLFGEQQEAVYIEISRATLSQAGLTPQSLRSLLSAENSVADAGETLVDEYRLRIAPTGDLDAVEALRDLILPGGAGQAITRLGEVARVYRDYVDPPQALLRFNGKPAIGMGISTAADGNVVTMGQAVRETIDAIMADTPIGIELGVIAYQSETVQEAIQGFVTNLLEALVIVIGLLLVFMGLRSGLLMGAILLLTIASTFIVMRMFSINLQSISLGALIIALGMLVDNAIVITEGALVRMQTGVERVKAVIDTVAESIWPLLGATIVGLLAFAAIGASQDNTGEYCRSLFQVVAIALFLSWILAVTVTPLFCALFLRPGKTRTPENMYKGPFYKSYRGILAFSIRRRWLTMGMMVLLLFSSFIAFSQVDKSFFPDSTRPQFMVDYWLPEGADIQRTANDLAKIELFLMEQENVQDVTSFVGQGGLRFLLTYAPQSADSSYGQLIVTVPDYRVMPKIMAQTKEFLRENFPDAEPKLSSFSSGAGGGARIQARFTGPDSEVLRALSEKAKTIMAADPATENVRDTWRQKVKVLRPRYAPAQARRTGISRAMVASALEMTYTGALVGQYREQDKLIPIYAQSPWSERADPAGLMDTQIWNPYTQQAVPLAQVVSETALHWENPLIHRRNRSRCITAQCDPSQGATATLFARLRPQIEAIPRPPGYQLEWGGEFESSKLAQAGLMRLLPLSFLAMALTVIILFNAFRQPLIIFLCVPLSLIGVTYGLLFSGQPFGFMALLGLLSLTGMLIKNAIVLIDQTDLLRRQGRPPYDAILDSSVSRVRPVLMAAMTTVLGMLPLAFDQMFASMAITIMAGLSFATVLTLVVVPVLYAIAFGVPPIPSSPDDNKEAP